MDWIGRALAALVWVCAGALPAWGGAAPAAADQRAPVQVRAFASDVVEIADHGRRPFAIVDKNAARLYVFDADGRLRGASDALLGQARGDLSAPGVGDRAQRGPVPPEQRTTPAGRFVSEPGRNLEGEHVIWVDYEAAFAIHRLRPGAGHASRVARLNSPTPDDNRVSSGCVIVPAAFYSDVVAALLGRRSVVYVLPEQEAAMDLLARGS